MTRDEVRKLLGGYATGTLTAEEQQALFEAALQDQDLFDELAREQPLRDLLRDPAARAHLLASIEETPRPWWRRVHRGAWIGAAAVAASLALAVILHFDRSRPAAAPSLVAELKPELARNAAPNLPAPPPAEEAKKDSAPVKTRQGTSSTARSLAAPANPETARKKDAGVQRQPALVALPSPKPQAGPPAGTAESELAATGNSTSARLRAAAPSRAKTELADKDTNLAPPVATPAAALPPPPPPQSPTAAPSILQMQSLGALGGAPPAGAQDARALFYAQPALDRAQFQAGEQFRQLAIRPAATALMVPNPGVKWTALRRQEDGLFSQVDPEQIKAGDIIRLRLVPNDNGYLSVMDGSKPLVAERRVARLEPVETPAISGAAGKKELIVVLSRRAPAGQHNAEPEKAESQPQPPQATAAGLLRPVAAEQLSQADRNEHAVYEVKKGSNPLAPVLVRITLNFQ